MPARTNCSPPYILCTCGATRTYPIDIGLPPVGTEAMCTECFRCWKLDSYDFTDSGGTRWAWTADDQPANDVQSFNLLARRALGVEAALAGLGITWRARGLA